jgi:hypothetical protein
MPCVKALSVTQPWATLLLLGAKRFETRAWQTGHRGLLAIHATRELRGSDRELCRTEPFRSLLAQAGFDSWTQLPLGVVLGTVELVRCVRVEELEAEGCSAADRQFGDFRPGRWAWEMANPKPLAVPVLLRGRLGVFDVTLSLSDR